MKKILMIVLFFLIINLAFAETKKVATLKEVINPYTMVVDSGKIFIVEGHTIYIYSAKNLTLEKKFGKKGEGPGEFKVLPTANMGCVKIEVLPECISVVSIGRISYFTKDGEYIKEIKTSYSWANFKPLGKSTNSIGRGQAYEDGINYNTVKLFDSNLENGKEIIRCKSYYSPGKYVNPFLIYGPAYYVIGDKAYIEKEKDAIQVFDNEGKLFATLDINIGYKKVKVTGEEKAKYLDFFKTEPAFKTLYSTIKRDIKYPDYYPGIRLFHVNDGKLYILRWSPDTDKQEIAIFSPEGKLLKNITVPMYMKNAIAPYAYAISDGKFYQLIENEDNEGEWNLLVTDL